MGSRDRSKTNTRALGVPRCAERTRGKQKRKGDRPGGTYGGDEGWMAGPSVMVCRSTIRLELIVPLNSFEMQASLEV